MFTESTPKLFYRGDTLDTSPRAFGELRSSRDARADRDELHRRMAEDGYLYLPGLLNPKDVEAARIEFLERIDRLGNLAPGVPVSEGVAKKDGVPLNLVSQEGLAKNNLPLEKVIFSGPMIEFYEFFLGGVVRHFDFIWVRAKVAGQSITTYPHYDNVYMGRGTQNLFTSWTPFGDVPLIKGGLMILENSHRLEEIKATYGQMDVDAYCTNNEEAQHVESAGPPGDPRWPDRVNQGAYTQDAVGLQQEVQRRWLTTNYQAGDLLVFSMFTMHAGMDNQTQRYRLSTDTRYQLAAEPVDERWVGDTIIGHGPEGKKGMIC
jgi:hypothetical protein